jgi:hypothetical protein
MKSSRYNLIAIIFAAQLAGCHIHRAQAKVLIPGIDIDQTLVIAEMELEENKFTAVLTYWAMRDQVFTKEQAKKASDLYFKYIDKIDSEDHKARGFNVWHLTWAVSNIYRLGDDGVKSAMEEARRDAAVRVKKLDSGPATKHFSGEKILMGDIHFLGRSYAKKHLVVPGNDKYVQSVDAYKKSLEED